MFALMTVQIYTDPAYAEAFGFMIFAGLLALLTMGVVGKMVE
jgi:hypothetical protein